MAIILQPTFWLLLLFIALILLGIGLRRKLRWLPAGLLRFVLLALVGCALLLPALHEEAAPSAALPPREILIIGFAGLDPESPFWEDAAAWEAEQANRLVLSIASPVDSTQINPENWIITTGLPGALALAGHILQPAGGRVILALDDRQQEPGVLDAVKGLRGSAPGDLVVDLIPLKSKPASSAIVIGDLIMPSDWWEGIEFSALLPVYSQAGGAVQLAYSINEGAYIMRTFTLDPGENRLSIPLSDKDVQGEILTIAASLVLDEIGSLVADLSSNQSAFGATRLRKSPQVLLLTTDLGKALPFGEMLREAGFRLDFLAPADFRPDSSLERYDVFILHNFTAEEFQPGQVPLLKDLVSREGKGLLILGGLNSYTLGGYNNTEIEPMLPVLLQPPPQDDSGPMTFVLVMDRSYSMSYDNASNIPPILLAKEAAIRTVEALNPGDYLGVLTYQAEAEWAVPITRLQDRAGLRVAQDAISQIAPFGGTKTYNALQMAIVGMGAQSVGDARHILLLSDGASADGSLDEFAALARDARSEGITISTIALGIEADAGLMSLLAVEGGGRFYQVDRAANLPRIMVAESQAARRENIQPGLAGLAANPIFSDPQSSHPLLNFAFIENLPPINGYNSLQRRPAFDGAEDVFLAVGTEDPLLSTWQYGLGRVTAWMSDIGENWAASYTQGPRAGAFWTQVIRYSLPSPGLRPEQISITADNHLLSQTRSHIQVELETSQGMPHNGLLVEYVFSSPGEQVQLIPLSQTAPGFYQGMLPELAPGAYRGVLIYTNQDGTIYEQIPYPLTIQPKRASLPRAQDLALETLPQLVGGVVVNQLKGPEPGEITSVSELPIANLSIRNSVLLALVVFWIVEIAIRRRWLPWQ